MADPYIRPDAQAFLAFLAASPARQDLPPAETRAMYMAMKDIVDPPVGELGAVIDTTVPGPGGDIPVRLFDPRATREAGPAIMFFHGGGFVLGNIETHASLCAEMARVMDMPVISVDYRLAPENPWPAAPDDCEAAARWAASSPAALGRTNTGLILSGDSAGGTLAIVTAMALRDAPAAVPVIAQLPFYPAADMATEHPSYSEFAEGFFLTRNTMDWFAAAYQADLAHPRGSPMAGDISGLPPAVVVTASLDPIRDQGRAYAAALIQAGIPTVFQEAKGNIHGFANLRQAVASSQGDLAKALAALKQVIAVAQ